MAIPAKQIGIYKITSPSGRVYIGQSWNIQRRFKEYKSTSSVKSQRLLYNSLIKYGYDNHTFNIIKICDLSIVQDELDNLEIFYINLYKTQKFKLLNIKDGGSKGKLPKSSIDKMLLTRGKWNHTEETKKKISNSHKGILHSTDAKIKISNFRKNFKVTDDTRKKLSDLYKKRINSGDIKILTSEINKKIILDKETGVFYIGVEDAAIIYSFKTATLRKKLNGQLKNNTNLIYV